MKIAARVAIAVLVVAYASLLLRNLSWAAGGADSSGYLNEARMIRRGQMRVPIPLMSQLHVGSDWAEVFTPLGFGADWKDRRLMVPLYPPGLPAHFAVAGAIGGFTRGPFLIPPLAGILSLLLMIAIGRQLGLTDWQSIAAAAILGASAVFLFMTAQPMSDVVATAWTLAMIALALATHGNATLQPARRRPGAGSTSALAGAAFAISVCVRPSNVLMAIPLAVALRFRIRALLLAAAAAVPIGIALMLWNHTLYGSYFSTGYGSMRELLAWSYPRQRLPHYSFWLVAQFSPLVFPGGLFAAFDRRIDRWHRALLVSWFFPLFAFYCFYDSYDTWWYTRFLLPAIPPLILGFFLIVRRLPKAAMAIGVIIALGVAVWQDNRLHPLTVGADESIYTDTMRWVGGQLPHDAIVLAFQFSGSFFFYLDRDTVRYDGLDANRFEELRAYAGAANLRWYAVLMDWEMERFHLPGKWTPIGKNRDVMLLRLDN